MTVSGVGKWVLVVLLLAHGAVHLLGFLWAFGLAEPREIGAATLLADSVPGSPVMVAFGAVWLVCVLAFLVAALGIARDASWGFSLIAIAATISLIVTLMWWDDASVGAILSGSLVIYAVVAPRIARLRKPTPVS